MKTMMLAEAGATSLRVSDYVTQGGPVGYVLVGLSLVAVAVCVANLIQLRMSRLAPKVVSDELEVYLREHDIDGAVAFCRDPVNDCFLTRMFSAALMRCTRSAFGFLELRSALEEAGQRQVDRLSKLTDAVGLVAALGPMLGLLGTVGGMIGAFQTIGTLEGAARSNELAVYMSHALVTTFLGLVVAIPCTAAYTVFRRRLDRLAGEVGQVAEGLASLVTGRGGTRAAGVAKPGAARAPAAGGVKGA